MDFYNKSYRIETMLTEAQLDERIQALGAQITEEYRDRGTVVLVGVLRGSFMFIADLVRAIDLPIEVDFIGVSSYGDAQSSSGVVRLTQDLTRPVEDKHVLLVEDIVDTGLTIDYLMANLATRRPASIKVCTLLHKPDNKKIEVPLDYVGFEIENKFVVGYGLDHSAKLRNLPFIGVVTGTP
ncbi:MAG: hypoxanthine phosphoribosyltransferase [Bradymonadia bacterium]